METKGLDYDPIFKVPSAPQGKHEICLAEVTDNPKHANDVDGMILPV